MIVLVASFDIVVAVVFRFDIVVAVVLQSVQIILRWSFEPRATQWTRNSFSCCFFFASFFLFSFVKRRVSCQINTLDPITINVEFQVYYTDIHISFDFTLQ